MKNLMAGERDRPTSDIQSLSLNVCLWVVSGRAAFGTTIAIAALGRWHRRSRKGSRTEKREPFLKPVSTGNGSPAPTRVIAISGGKLLLSL